MVATADAEPQPAPEATPVAPSFLERLRRSHVWGKLAIAAAIAAPVCGVLTYGVITGSIPFDRTPQIDLALVFLNLVLILLMGALVAWRLVALLMARRSGAAGARLHARLVAAFSLVAAAPAIILAGFAASTLNYGMEAWFSERVRTVVSNAVDVAEGYVREHRNVIRADLLAMANDLNRAAPLMRTSPKRFSELVATQAALRALPEAYVIDSENRVLARANMSFSIGFQPLDRDVLDAAAKGEVVILTDDEDAQVRALVRLENFVDAYLHVSRFVDARVLGHLRETRDAREAYRQLEGKRTQFTVTFAVLYVGLALLLLLAAIWLALWFANRIVQPISSLVGAAERISSGDLRTRVAEPPADDEIGALARAFNRMTGELGSQRDELVEANKQIDRRRRFTEAVLSGVTSAVIGLDRQGRIELLNRAAPELLGRPRDELINASAVEAAPEIAPLLRRALARPGDRVEGQVQILRDGERREFQVRVTSELSGAGNQGFVVTLDDITGLVSAQRTAAWADVARRIAHEIKNPLTPIQLSAERLKRKYEREIETDPGVFTRCVDTIVRQVGDIRRMVDEFSSFARMPAPRFERVDLAETVREAVTLRRAGHPGIAFESDLGAPGELTAECDARLISQALTNVLKNAAEAVAARAERMSARERAGFEGRVVLSCRAEEARIVLEIADNGCGLPPEESADRLTEPYVTTRAKGTGLGLAIVRKIMEDHGGGLTIADREDAETGARARLTLATRQGDAGPAANDAQDAPQERQQE